MFPDAELTKLINFCKYVEEEEGFVAGIGGAVCTYILIYAPSARKDSQSSFLFFVVG